MNSARKLFNAKLAPLTSGQRAERASEVSENYTFNRSKRTSTTILSTEWATKPLKPGERLPPRTKGTTRNSFLSRLTLSIEEMDSGQESTRSHACITRYTSLSTRLRSFASISETSIHPPCTADCLLETFLESIAGKSFLRSQMDDFILSVPSSGMEQIIEGYPFAKYGILVMWYLFL